MNIQESTRTTKSLKNSAVALALFIVAFLLNFISRKVFLDGLGEDVLGLTSTTQNILSFLNIAELGISYAVSFTLYKPLFNNDREAINEIVDLQRHLYRYVAYIIMIGGIAVMTLFPVIFAKMTLPLWYAYASFIVFMASALLGYFVNFKQIVLTAAQLDYKVQLSFRVTQLIKLLAQIVAVLLVPGGYIIWLAIELLFAIISAYALHRTTMRTFPWLARSGKKFSELKAKYSEFITKIKQVFVHKISGFALSQSAPLIIYAYTSLGVVAMYGNYLIIVNGLNQLIGAVFNGFSAGIGNLVAENDKKKIWKVFNELFSLRMFIAGTVCFVLAYSAGDFVKCWIGEQYVFPWSTTLLIVATLFISISRSIVDSYIGAYGLYQDIGAPAVEATLNIGCSILLGYYFGINGILCGMLISLIVIVILWKPYFLFTRAMKGHLFDYIKIYAIHIIAIITAAWSAKFILDLFLEDYFSGWWIFIAKASAGMVLYGLLLLIILIALKCGIIDFGHRIKSLIAK